MLTFAIIDPNPVFALGLELLVTRGGLGQSDSWHYVSDAARALARRPADLILVSERMIGEFASSPIDCSRNRIVVIVDSKDHGDLARHQSAGFTNFLLRDSSEERMAECLQSVASGRPWLDPALHESYSPHHGWHCLSKRQLEVATMAACGLSNKHIARNLKLSDGTVKIHLHHVFAKLQVSRRKELGTILGH